jgi:hypothetical protein
MSRFRFPEATGWAVSGVGDTETPFTWTVVDCAMLGVVMMAALLETAVVGALALAAPRRDTR